MLTSHAHAAVNSSIFLDVLLFDVYFVVVDVVVVSVVVVVIVVIVSSDHWHHNDRVIPSHVLDQLVLMFASEVALVSRTGQQCGQMDPLDMVAHLAAQITAEAAVRVETLEHAGHVRVVDVPHHEVVASVVVATIGALPFGKRVAFTEVPEDFVASRAG